MRSLYITTTTTDGRDHNYRMAPRDLILEKGETVKAVREATWRVYELVDTDTVVRMHKLHQRLSGLIVRG